MYGEDQLQAQDISGSNNRSIEQLDFSPNSLVTGWKLSAYSATQESDKSSAFPDTHTLIEEVSPTLVSRVGSEIVMKIDELPTNLAAASSGIQFEIKVDDGVDAAAISETSGDWIQESTYAFTGIDPDSSVEIRARSRNQDAINTAWSPYIQLGTEEVLPATLAVSLSMTTIDGNPLPTPIDAQETLFGTIIVSNTGGGTANNVFVDLPIPEYLFYVSGSLQIEGNLQSDGSDGDEGQTSNNFISAIWSELSAGESRSVTFQLRFDTESLAILANPRIEQTISDSLQILQRTSSEDREALRT